MRYTETIISIAAIKKGYAMADITSILLRLDDATRERIDMLKARLELHERRSLPRSQVLQRLLVLGCEALDAALTTAPIVPSAPKEIAPLAPLMPQREIPAHLIAIADARAQYSGLSLSDFAQLLYDRDIYRATGKDGTLCIANRGTLKKMLDRCERLGLL